jgi:hypothetical protein
MVRSRNRESVSTGHCSSAHLTPAELIRPQKVPGAMYINDLIGPGNLREEPLGPRKTIEDLPQQIKEFCDRSLVVWPTDYVDGVPTIMRSVPLSPRNMISIGFSKDPRAYKYYQSWLAAL